MQRVILIIGVPGAGKSTVARALATHFDRSACLEGDLVQHHFTVSGLVGPDEAPVDEARRQLRLRWRNCADLADNFADEGFTVIVEHAATDQSLIDLFQATLRTRPLSIIVLAPSPDVATRRDRDRSDKHVAHLFPDVDADMRANLAGTGWWLDTSDLTVEQTVNAILATGLIAGESPDTVSA